MNEIDEKNSWYTAVLRRILGIPDKNMFVTNFVLYSILECLELKILKPDY